MPLVFFYGRLELDLPRLGFLEGAAMPEPHHHLLVHQSDMTPRLRNHHGSTPQLTVVTEDHTPEYVIREVVLTCEGRPVEYGAIGIHLEGFPPHVKELIRGGSAPLGAIRHSGTSRDPRGHRSLSVGTGTMVGVPVAPREVLEEFLSFTSQWAEKRHARTIRANAALCRALNTAEVPDLFIFAELKERSDVQYIEDYGWAVVQ